MLTKKMEKALNEQIAMEAHASALYLAMSSWCDLEGMEGSKQYMFRQSDEERDHMLRLFNYVQDMDGHAQVPAVHQPPLKWNSIQEMFKEVYEHEKKVTASINKLVELSTKENDHTTFSFLQWYVEEQREEEVNMRSLLDRIKLIGGGPQSLYYIDKEVERLNAEELAAAQSEK